MLFYTKSGSIYEVDKSRRQIRKVFAHEFDALCGNWYDFEGIDLELSKPAIIAWNRFVAMITSDVTRIVEDRDLS